MAFFVEICPILAKIFKKFQLQDFFCDYINGLHLCDNFGVFNINIEGFIGKNSEKILKNDPPFSYIKGRTPKIESVISSERSWILIFRKKRWNHSYEIYKISFTCFLTPDLPLSQLNAWKYHFLVQLKLFPYTKLFLNAKFQSYEFHRWRGHPGKWYFSQ